MYKVFFLFLLTLFSTILSFKNLNQLIKYDSLHPIVNEKVIRDINEWGFDFSLHNSFFKNHLISFDLSTSNIWNIQIFKELLDKVVHDQHLRGYYGNFVFKITPMPGSNIIVFGALHGALFSIVRSLIYLKKRKIIDENFKIIKPDTFIIFNGDLVSGALYTLESLTVILQLLHKNPGRVFYVKGNDENKSYWLNDGMNLQLNYWRTLVHFDLDEMREAINIFFNSLPLAIYIGGKIDENIIRISYYNMDYNEIDESHCMPILTSSRVSAIEKCTVTMPKEETSIVGGIIKAENRLINYQRNTGLTTLESDYGATAWRIFSAPTLLYQKFFQFFFDSFVVIRTGDSIMDHKITLYNRDIRINLDFENSETYNLLTTIKLPPEDSLDVPKNDKDFTAEEIKRIQTKLKKVTLDIKNLAQDVDSFFAIKKLISDKILPFPL